MMLKCIIVDDEPLASKVIEDHISKVPNIEVVSSFTNPVEAMEVMQKGNIDVVFLDINMPVINGLDFVKTLENPPKIVFTTAYREYAVESFELDVFDYLVKPVPFTRFMKTVNKLNNSLGERKGNKEDNRAHTFIKIDKKLIKIYFDEILYTESLKDYIKIFTPSETHLVHQTLTSFTDELPPDTFIRIHRSFTISVPKVNSIMGNSVEIAGKQIPIGRNYVQEVKDMILG